MKKIGEVLELPLIAIDEGVECGKVKELLVNPGNGKVEYLIIDDGQWYLGAKLLPFGEIVGMGIDAVTTHTQSNIKNFGEVEEAIELAGKNIKILGARCYTQKGKFVGIVKEYYINEEDGTIIGCEMDTQGVLKIIQASSILTYGKDVLIVADNVEEVLVSDFKEDSQVEHEENNTSKLFEQRHIQFLLGRKASKRIVDQQGNVLIDRDQLVTEDVIDKIKACGKLVELTMNTRA